MVGLVQESTSGLNRRVISGHKALIPGSINSYYITLVLNHQSFSLQASFQSVTPTLLALFPFYYVKMKSFTIVAALCLALAISANAQNCPITAQDVNALDLKPVKPACGKIFQVFNTFPTSAAGLVSPPAGKMFPRCL
jgi:hypothetical protein